MTTRRDAVLDQFEVLTQRTFLVLDTEFCIDDEGNHLISLGCVPVVRGKRGNARQELHLVMNPGVPIDDATRRVHGFTDADVARKRGFRHYAPRILAYLDSFEADNPVLVTHTGTDVHLLRTELERLADTDTHGDGDGDTGEVPTLPLMPLIDTSVLHRVIGLDGLSAGPAKLSALCSRLGVTNRGAHDALHDARATADVLVALLLHAAGNFTGRHAYADLDALLAAHNAGTTHEPRVGQVWRTRGWVEPLLPADHAARHARTDLLLLPGRDATSDDLADWVTTAEACVKLRCPHLPPAAALAAPGHAASLWDPLWTFATTATAPGEAGTALAALMRLLDTSYGADPADEPLTPVSVPDTTAGALTHATAMPWWRRNRAAVDGTIACERSGSAACPDCRGGRGCSRDRFYEPVARIATFGRTGAIDKNNIKNRLFGRVGGERTPKRAYYDWTDPRCVAHMVWLVVTWTKSRNQGVTAAKYLAQARADDYHLHDPRLARLVCESIAETSGLDSAAAEVRRVLNGRSSDPAWDELTSWLTWRQHAAARAARASAARVITYPRLARPRGRANANPYLP